jgi:predicted deacylase
MKGLVLAILCFQAGLFVNAHEKARNYREQISFIFGLSDKFAVTETGTVDYPENSYTMYKVTYNAVNETGNRRYLFISCVHGNEIAPVYAIKDFILYLDSKEQVINNTTIDFIYILNPYGFEYAVRHNGEGKDLNRDFISSKTQEIKLLMNDIKNTEYTGVYDFHEHSATKGFFYTTIISGTEI